MNMSNINYNPDVLTCLANLSNDEVFTPPEIANSMLDLLPQELFSDPNSTFLDPCTKTGVFLREIVKRLIAGLETKIPDLQERVDHILHKQVFGIAITEITSLLARRSLYCSKYPNSKYSISLFTDIQGNIRFKNKRHTWKDGKCVWCGASYTLERDVDLESHAYEFIHTRNLEELFGMKFDVIVSNPPYQLNVGQQKENYAIPIYQKFVEQAKKLNPRYITMIIPARWFAGGRNLDAFRKAMLEDDRIRKIVDFPNPYDCFQGVDISGGVCYFLWDRDHHGDCNFTSCVGGQKTVVDRVLNEYSLFIRDAKGLNIVRKIEALNINNGANLSDVVSPQTPYGIITSYKPLDKGQPCWFKQKLGLQFVKPNDVSDIQNTLDMYKLLIPEAPIAGQSDFTKPVGLYYEGNTVVANPGECCSQTWLVAAAFNTKQEVLFFRSYLLTKIVRFLILQTVVSQHVSREKFIFVPDLGVYDHEFTDKELVSKWGISDEEWEYIDSRIHNYNVDK